MPINKNAFQRFLAIDSCLKNRKSIIHTNDLVLACSSRLGELAGKDVSVSIRTIYADLKFMRDSVNGFDAPIEFDRINGYMYTRPNYSILNHRLKKSEQELLYETISILENLWGNHAYRDLQPLIERLKEFSNLESTTSIPNQLKIEQSLNVKGQGRIDELRTYIKKKEVTSIHYQPFGKDLYHRKVSPYLIKEYNNRWFLIGYDHELQKISPIGMDRIQMISPSLTPFITPPEDLHRFHDQIVGVTIIDEEHAVDILFETWDTQTDYIITKPIHPSQTLIKREENHALFKIHVIPNFELESMFLSFGERLHVLSPPALQSSLHTRIEKMLQLYNSNK